MDLERHFLELIYRVLHIDGNIKPEEVTMQMQFKSFKDYDSLMELQMIAMINEQFNITISYNQYSELNNVRDLYNYINKQLVGR